MLLSKETTIKLNNDESNIIGHMCYAAFKLWNVCNYERLHYTELGLNDYPDWYYQKKHHKDDMWYKMLPSQTAQEVCKVLDKSWKSFFKLKKTGGIENPGTPRFKKKSIPITYMQNGIKLIDDTTIRLSIPKAMKTFMSDEYGIHADYLFLKNNVFQNMDVIKQIRLYPSDGNVMRVIVIYEVAEPVLSDDNGNYLSIDLGLNNPFTCYDSKNGKSFIFGRMHGSILQYYDKKIAHYQSISGLQQAAKSVKYPKPSRRVLQLYNKKKHCIKDYMHKCTKYIVNYCIENNINTVVIGDIKHIRDNSNLGNKTNQRFHSLPFEQIYAMLEYKLRLSGIRLVKVKESYSSQCSPLSPAVSKEYAVKGNRKCRGLYTDGVNIWNADCVGAYNILRLYMQHNEKDITFNAKGLSSPCYVKVAV